MSKANHLSPMTVAELIAILSEMNPELPVVVNGYEGGYTALTQDRVYQMTVYRHGHEPLAYSGELDDVRWYEPNLDGEREVFDCIVLSRNEKD